MQVDKIICKISGLVQNFDSLTSKLSDVDKKELLARLKCFFIFSMNILAVSTCKESGGHPNFQLCYKNKRGQKITTSLKLGYIDKMLRQFLIFAAWGWFECFFSEKVLNSTSLTTGQLVKKYYENQNKCVPNIIDFFRETRNCLHSNGIYNQNKKQ